MNTNERLNDFNDILKTQEKSISVNRNEDRTWDGERGQSNGININDESRERRQPEKYAEIFEHDVIYFVDSHLKGMDADMFGKHTSGKKIMTYKLEHIREVINASVFVCQPKTIFIHCGTNHLHHNIESTNELEDQFIKTLKLLENRCPESTIVVSSLLPCKEGRVNKMVNEFNDFLYGVAVTASNVFFMQNCNVTRNMLVGLRQINSDGFYILLANIRSTLFVKRRRHHHEK